MKYRKRVLLSFALILVVPILLNDFLIFSSIRSREIALKTEYIRGQAEQMRRTVDYLVSKIQSDFVFLSYKQELRYLKQWYEESDYRAKKRFLDDFDPFSILSGYYDAAYIVHPDDDIMIDLKSKLISPIKQSRDHARIERVIQLHDAYGGKRELFTEGEEGHSDTAYLVKSVPIPERGTRMILYMELSDNLFKGALDDIFLIEGSYAIITDREGEVIEFRSKEGRIDAANAASYLPTASSTVYAADESGVVKNAAGKFLVTTASSPDSDWSYHYGLGFAPIDAAILSVLLRYSLFTVLVLLAFSLIVRRVSRGVYEPVLGLAALFKEAEEDGGDALSGEDELKDIQEGLRHLIARNAELSVSASDNSRYGREAFLRSLVLESPRPGSDPSARVRALGLDLPADPFARFVVCVGVARVEDAQRDVYADAFYGNKDSPFLRRFVLPEGASIELCMVDERRFALIVGGADLDEADFDALALRMVSEEEPPLFVGASAVHRGLYGIHDAYHEALIALEYRTLLGGERFVRYADAVARKASGYFYPADAERRIVACIKQLDSEGAEEQFRAVADTVVKAGVSFSNAKRLYSHLADSLLLVAKDFDLPVDSALLGGEADLGDRIDEAVDTAEADALVRGLAVRLIERLRSTKEAPTVAIANAVKDFIDLNYSDRNLSLDLIADKLSYSVSHLSSVFKDTFGETIKDYITGLRLARARELLVKTDQHINVIGTEVGYDNLGSFVKIFKAYLGETPKGYRLRVRGK